MRVRPESLEDLEMVGAVEGAVGMQGVVSQAQAQGAGAGQAQNHGQPARQQARPIAGRGGGTGGGI